MGVGGYKSEGRKEKIFTEIQKIVPKVWDSTAKLWYEEKRIRSSKSFTKKQKICKSRTENERETC